MYALGNCNPVVSLDALSGVFSISSTRLGFRLYVNLSYAALADTGQLNTFISSTRDAIAIAFRGPIGLNTDTPSLTKVYIRSMYASAWPNTTQGTFNHISCIKGSVSHQ